MNRKPDTALATLLRWREFEEQGAANRYQQRTVEVVRSQERRAQAHEALAQVQRRIEQAMAGEHLDLAALQLANRFEERAWQAVDDRQADLETACTAQAEAQGVHVQARARSRVVASRHQRACARESERLDKLAFDRMADLLASARGTSRD